MSSKFTSIGYGVVALALTTTLATAAGAQDYISGQYDPAYRPAPPAQMAPPPPPAYDLGGYDTAPPPDYRAGETPPPPPGYRPDGDPSAQATADQRYAAYAEDWSHRYCVKARGDAGAGAVIGGVVGALFGSGVAGRHDRGTGALVGGLAGAGAGAAIGSASANQTSPGCPPGYVVRGDAPAFYYEGYGDPYLYAAPGWYQPWYFYGGRWAYRPYPYHFYYYNHFGYGRGYGYGYRGGYGRGYGYRGGYNRGGRR